MEQFFDLDEKSGRLFWKLPPKTHPRLKGKEAGRAVCCSGKLYWSVQINGKKIKRGRLVFFLKNKRWPTPCIDHINGNSLDDRPENLREATFLQNAWNHKSRKKQSTLPMGIKQLPSGRYQARIGYKNRLLNLGVFSSVEEAQKIYQQKRVELYEQFA